MSDLARAWASPSSVLLVVFLVGAGLLMAKLQRRKDFDWAQLVMDDKRMVSAGRFLAIGAFIVSSWVMMSDLSVVDSDFGLWYLASWSGSMVLSKAVDAYRDRGIEHDRYGEGIRHRGGYRDDRGDRDRGVVVRVESPRLGRDADEGTGQVGIGRERF